MVGDGDRPPARRATRRHARCSSRLRVTPLLRVGSTAFGHHYDDRLYAPMADRVVELPPPVGWQAARGRTLGDIDLLHLHWPEWVAFDDLADAPSDPIAISPTTAIPVVWTAHNLTPAREAARGVRPDLPGVGRQPSTR